MKAASRRYLFLKVSEFRDFLLETDANVLETDAFLLENWALDAVCRGSELVAGVFELKYFCSAGTNVTGLTLGRGGHGRSFSFHFGHLWRTRVPPWGRGHAGPRQGTVVLTGDFGRGKTDLLPCQSVVFSSPTEAGQDHDQDDHQGAHHDDHDHM